MPPVEMHRTASHNLASPVPRGLAYLHRIRPSHLAWLKCRPSRLVPPSHRCKANYQKLRTWHDAPSIASSLVTGGRLRPPPYDCTSSPVLTTAHCSWADHHWSGFVHALSTTACPASAGNTAWRRCRYSLGRILFFATPILLTRDWSAWRYTTQLGKVTISSETEWFLCKVDNARPVAGNMVRIGPASNVQTSVAASDQAGMPRLGYRHGAGSSFFAGSWCGEPGLDRCSPRGPRNIIDVGEAGRGG